MAVPSNRSEALAVGAKRFFTGRPCVRGHVAERFVTGRCVTCAAQDYKDWYKINADNIIVKNSERKIADPEKVRAIRAKSRLRHLDAARRRTRDWQAKNPDRMRAYAGTRRATQLEATPGWVDMAAIDAVYTKATMIQAETGIAHHVDHIIPLRGKTVCGLHVPWNLQVLTAKENGEKYNRLEVAE